AILPIDSDSAYAIAAAANIGKTWIAMSNHLANAHCAASSPGGRIIAARNAAPAIVKVLLLPSITAATTFDAGMQIAIMATITAPAASNGVPTDDTSTIINAMPNVVAVALKNP